MRKYLILIALCYLPTHTDNLQKLAQSLDSLARDAVKIKESNMTSEQRFKERIKKAEEQAKQLQEKYRQLDTIKKQRDEREQKQREEEEEDKRLKELEPQRKKEVEIIRQRFAEKSSLANAQKIIKAIEENADVQTIKETIISQKNLRDEDIGNILNEAVKNDLQSIVTLLLQKTDAKKSVLAASLKIAQEKNLTKMAKFLIDNEASVNEGHIIRALEKGQEEILEYILTKRKVPVNNTELGAELLATAIDKKMPKVLTALLKERNANPNQLFMEKSPLVRAIMKNDTEAVRLLLKYNADPYLIDTIGVDPVRLAINRKNKDILKVLLENGLDINKQYGRNQTALIMAIIAEFSDGIKLLVEKGANLNLPDEKGYTPLHLAVLKKDAELVKLLFENGAKPNIENKWGSTAADLAYDIGNPKILEYLKLPKIKTTVDTTKLYKILELKENATLEEINKQHKKLSKKWHPDRFAQKSEQERKQANDKMAEINNAHDILVSLVTKEPPQEERKETNKPLGLPNK